MAKTSPAHKNKAQDTHTQQQRQTNTRAKTIQKKNDIPTEQKEQTFLYDATMTRTKKQKRRKQNLTRFIYRSDMRFAFSSLSIETFKMDLSIDVQRGPVSIETICLATSIIVNYLLYWFLCLSTWIKSTWIKYRRRRL